MFFYPALSNLCLNKLDTYLLLDVVVLLLKNVAKGTPLALHLVNVDPVVGELEPLSLQDSL